MRRIMYILMAVALFIVGATIAFANVSSDLNNYFDGLGMKSNITSPHAVQGQQAGYYTGGSLYARDAVRNVQLVEIDLPNFRAGCGGIDLFAGGFSFVNHEQLVKTMRNIMNNAKGYAFKLALAEVTPLLKNVMSDIQDIANEANQWNINSCETAENLVGGIWPKTRAAQQQVCEDIGANNGMFSDWTAARMGCTSGYNNYDYDSVMQSGSQNPAYKSLVLDNGNLAWKALEANHLISGDQQFAELLMSLSGSIIIKKTGTGDHAKNQFETLPSLATNYSLFKAILYGGDAKIYRCDEAKKCLNPSKESQVVTIKQDSALINQVARLLRGISQKIIADEALDPQEKGLIQSTRIPVFKILNVQAAYQKDSNILDVESYADVIATDILFQYLQENLALVRASARSLQYPTDIMDQFNAGINIAMDEVRAEERSVKNRISQVMQLIEQSQVLEQMLAGQLSTQLGNSLNWARSLR